MQRTLDYLFLVVITLISVGCNRSTDEPTPTVVNAPTSIPIAMPSSALTTPITLAQLPSTSPILVPTVTPTLLPMVTPTSLPYRMLYTAEGMPISLTPIPSAPLVTCRPQEEVIECYDDLLNMTFRYPAFMGRILFTQLRTGGYSGYAYEYAFDNRESGGGGRSRDFSEGRGPMYTDQNGFTDYATKDICSGWVAAMCEELGPGALRIVILPQAEWLCSDAMMFQRFPRGILVLDLPQHPLINGFSFTFPLLSDDATSAFENEWYKGKECQPETKFALGKAMNQLKVDLQSGTASPEIQQRYDAMLALAASIQSPYVAKEP